MGASYSGINLASGAEVWHLDPEDTAVTFFSWSHPPLKCFSGGSVVKNPLMLEIWVRSLCQENPLEKGMAAHSSILAWEIPWTEEPGRLQCMGSQRVEHD